MVRVLLAAALVTALSADFAASAQAGGPLRTAIYEIDSFRGAEAQLAFSRVRGAGSSVVRLALFWDEVAPNGRPADPTAPGDSAYSWDSIDQQVRLASGNGLIPLVTVARTPVWAQQPGISGRAGWIAPKVDEFAAFATAAARRFDGNFDPDGAGPAAVLPEVLLWEVWNEPNLSVYFMPQRDASGASIAPALYRDMVNAFSTAVHSVDARNVVVGGTLAPFGAPDGHMPLDFMRRMLCMSGGNTPRPVCSTQIHIDVWSHHPYTSGGPTHHAYWPDDVSLGDLPEMRRLLRAAVRAGHIVSSRAVGFWVTEFSWESKPPDPLGLSTRLHARWTSEALYRMWLSGVNLVVWHTLRDRPFPTSAVQAGLYYCGGRTTTDDDSCYSTATTDVAKLSLKAFKFPFVAFPRNGRVFTWGRTPAGAPGRVVIQRRTPSGWRRVGVLRTNQYGIFQTTWRISATRGVWRARLARKGEASVGFSLRRVPDRPLVHPFGCGGGLPC